MKSSPNSILNDPAVARNRVITVSDAAGILGCGVTRLYELLAAGAIRSYKDGNNRRVYLTSVQEYQEGITARGPALGIAPSPRARARAKAAR
jgi:excisionase family DNA binding protein